MHKWALQRWNEMKFLSAGQWGRPAGPTNRGGQSSRPPRSLGTDTVTEGRGPEKPFNCSGLVLHL